MNVKTTMRRSALATAAALAFSLAACGSVPPAGPGEWPPALPGGPGLPAAFAQGHGLAAGAQAQADWWRVLGDPVLDQLVAQGLAANLDLQRAAERVQQSRALAAGRRAAQGPAVGLAAGARAQRSARGAATGPGDEARRSDSVDAGVDLSWELDLFGRLRNAAGAADARGDAAAADADALRLAVAAEIAQAWFALDGAREQRQLAQAVVHNRGETLDLVLRRVAAGFSAPLDEARARAELAAAEAELPLHDAALSLARHRLAVLLGASPTGFEAPQAGPREAGVVMLRLPAPAQWVALRPDLRAAQAQLRAQALDVEAVRAEFMPRLSIGGLLGFVAGSASGLGAAGSTAWFVAPSVSLPLFDAGRIQARLQHARAGQREALLAYHQRVLLATEEVENALVQVRQGQQRLAALQDQARHAGAAETLARHRYAAGGTDLLELLDAQRGAQQAGLALSRALSTQRQHVVALQRALGARFEPAAGGAVQGRAATAAGAGTGRW